MSQVLNSNDQLQRESRTASTYSKDFSTSVRLISYASANCKEQLSLSWEAVSVTGDFGKGVRFDKTMRKQNQACSKLAAYLCCNPLVPSVHPSTSINKACQPSDIKDTQAVRMSERNNATRVTCTII